MSRHHFFVDRADPSPLSVVVGWDRPCAHYFVNVTDPDLPEDVGLVYSSSSDVALFRGRIGLAFGGLSLEELQGKLAELNLPAPKGLLDRLAFEAAVNVGNHVQAWGTTRRA